MMIRRAFLQPAKLDYARPDRAPGDPQYDRRRYEVGDWVFVGTLLVIALTGFLLEGVRIAMSDPGYGGTQFGGWIVAQALTGLSHRTLAGLRHGLWWFHGLLAIDVRGEHPVHQGGAHADELCLARRCATRSPASGLRRSRPSAPPSPPGTRRFRTSASCTCSSSTRARSAAAATRRARRTRPAGRSPRAT